MVSSYSMMIAGPANDQIKTVQDLIAFAKANPEKSNYPTASPTFTISSELLKLKTGMPGQLVPYRSSNEMMLSIVGGQTLFAFADAPSIIPVAKGGRVRALAVATDKRMPELPDVPTLAGGGAARRRGADAVERHVPAARHTGGDREEARSGLAAGADGSGGARTHAGARLHPGRRRQRGVPSPHRRRHQVLFRRGEGGQPEVRAVAGRRITRAPSSRAGAARVPARRKRMGYPVGQRRFVLEMFRQNTGGPS